MNRAISAALLAIAWMFAPALVPIPQSVAQAPAPGQEMRTSTINLTVEQRHVIKEIVKDMPVENAPEGAVLRAFPSEITQKVPSIKSHKFFVKGQQVVIVSPDGNDVVEIIE
jgi:hypothetical protein